MTNNQNISNQSQQAGSNEIEESTTNNQEEISLLWDNSADHLQIGQQEEILNSSEPQQDPLITNEKKDTKVYENTKQTTNENHTNELLESMTTAREANLAELNMTLRSKEKLKEPTRFKDYVKE